MNLRFFRLCLLMMLTGAAGLTALRAQPTRGPGEMRGPREARGPGGPGEMGPGGPGAPDLVRELFPPELVMRHQTEIDLSEEQKKSLVREMQSLQSDLVPMQFDMSEAAGKLRAALAAPRIDEEKAGALADRLMTLESRIKRRHLALMIRIKNILTPEQQGRLRELREARREEAGPRRGNFDRQRGRGNRRGGGAWPGGDGGPPPPPGEMEMGRDDPGMDSDGPGMPPDGPVN